MITSTRVCSACLSDTKVIDSRFDELTGMINRERVCLGCKRRYKTLEMDCRLYDKLNEYKTAVDRLGELVNAK